MTTPGPAVPAVEAIVAGNRTAIGRAITLVESTHPDHRASAAALLESLMVHAGRAHRVGITGVPGVGKSTFIDALGTQLTTAGHRVAVLAVDPSSSVTGGSILGDKTRMERLSIDPNAFIRPSPASGELGGVARSTRESMIVLEAAGYDIVLVETVGVGQSETVVAEMVDFFLVLMLPGAGDELQGIKKGVLELADVLAVNKSDADPAATRAAVRDYTAALRLLTPTTPTWNPPVHAVSGLHGDGLSELWAQVELHRTKLESTGEFGQRRSDQQVRWMWSMVDDRVRSLLRSRSDLAPITSELGEAVRSGSIPATVAADRLFAAFIDADRRD